MAFDILVHFCLEALGGLGLRCVVGMCDHKSHRIIAWIVFGLISSAITVRLVG